jgi:hypothetical protein
MRHLAMLVAFATSACIGFNIIPSTDDSSSSSGDDASASPDDSIPVPTGVVTGVSCSVDPDTGDTLCQGISTCPGLLVDTTQFPGCGFRIDDPTDVDIVDLECACYGQICPIGITTSCTLAAESLLDQSQYTVCMQVDQGRCTPN